MCPKRNLFELTSAQHTVKWDLAVLGRFFWLILCALLPVSGAWVTLPLVASVILCIGVAVRTRPLVPWSVITPLLLYYALHLLGMAWTMDLDFGLFDLQIKAGLVLIPLCAFVLHTVDRSILRHSMIAFTGGMLLSVVLGLMKAGGCYAEQGMMNCFSQSTLSYEVHPSYAAWYGSWVLAYWGVRFLHGHVQEGRLKIFLLLALPVIVIFTAMLASKSGIISLALVMVALALGAILRLRGGRRLLVLALGASIASAAVLFQGHLIRDRMMAAVEAVKQVSHGDGSIYTSSDGNALRMVAWSCSLERLSMEPFGAGTGDIKHALMDCYDGKGASEASQRRLNAHSQWMQSAVALGWPGLLAFALVVLWGSYTAWRIRSPELALFMILFLMNSSVESVLEVQAGVIFFALFFGLLLCERTSQDRIPDPPSSI